MDIKQIIITALVAGTNLTTFARDLETGSKDTIFVGELKVSPSVVELNATQQSKILVLKRVTEILESQLVSALNSTRQFQLVDRKRMAEIREEQKLGELGQIDLNDKNVAQSMKLAGAKYIFQPQIDAFEDISETSQYQQIGRTSVSRKIFISAVVQIVDTTTGELLPDSPSVQLEKLDTVNLAKNGQALASDQFVVSLAKEVANQLAQKVVGTLRPAKVLTLTGNQAMINRGTEAGFKTGDIVEIYAVDKIIDEDSGEIFLNEVPVAQAKVVRGDTKQCFAILQGDNMGAQKGCVVRIIESTPVSVSPSASAAPEAKGYSTPGSSDKPVTF